MARVADEATAFGHRGATMMVNVAAMYERLEEVQEHEAWANRLTQALSEGVTAAAYVGFLGDEGEEGVRRAYPPATLERLTDVKHRYDPDKSSASTRTCPRTRTDATPIRQSTLARTLFRSVRSSSGDRVRRVAKSGAIWYSRARVNILDT